MGRASRAKLARRSQNKQMQPRLMEALIKDILGTAKTLYPGYVWACGATEDGGSMVNLVCMEPGIDTRYAYSWSTSDIQQTTDRKRQVMIACGSILERLHLARHKRTNPREVTGVERNGRGDLVMETDRA